MNIQIFRKNTHGFTLIELLVVIAIIGMLSAVVIASVSGARAKGFDARRLTDIKQLQLALDLYNETNGHYPPSLLDASFVDSGYIPKIPKDPTTNLNYNYAGLVGTAGPGVCGAYHLGATFQDPNNSAFSTAFGGTPGGAYNYGTSSTPPNNGPTCTGADFLGYRQGSNTVYDVRS